MIKKILENPFVVLTTYIQLHFKQVCAFHTENGPILQPLLSKTALCSSGGTVRETTWNSCHTGCSKKQKQVSYHLILDD